MKKTFLIPFFALLAIVSIAQPKRLSIPEVFKLAECTSNSCMFKYAREKGFVSDDSQLPGSDQYQYNKNRPDMSSGKADKLIIGIQKFWNSVLFRTYDPNVEVEFRQLIVAGELKETGSRKAVLGGTEKSFTSKSYPEYSATLVIKNEAGVNYYEIMVMRFIKN